MQELGWSSPDGCSKCRPALNYYLVCAWPGEYRDDPQSRLINERAHANIQKDGTSVVPRMGRRHHRQGTAGHRGRGRTLRHSEREGDGRARTDLLGVKKSSAPWADLNRAGMTWLRLRRPAHRKTCVGSCAAAGRRGFHRHGDRDRKATWGTWTPHKVKMGVSGCPRNCAEATVDFGVVAVESGWELHVGEAGLHVRPTDLLCKVATEQGVIEHCLAFLQPPGEARYLERAAPGSGASGSIT